MNTINKYITLSFVLFAAFAANAQVSIGGKQSVEGTTTILDFNSTATNSSGIMLSTVQNSPTFTITPNVQSPNNGTFLYDRTMKKVRMFENNTWVDLTDAGDSTKADNNANASDETASNQGAIIGSQTSSAIGVLVLESSDKAMILPRIANPDTTVKGPYPGMMCYDTFSKSLAVFDGAKWHYWK